MVENELFQQEQLKKELRPQLHFKIYLTLGYYVTMFVTFFREHRESTIITTNECR